MYAMADYDTYWLGLSYKGFDFRETHRDVTTGADVQMMARATGREVSRSDRFWVLYRTSDTSDPANTSLSVTIQPLDAFPTTIDMAPSATPVTIPWGRDAWTMGEDSVGGDRSLFFTKDNVQVILHTNTSINLLQVAADLRLIRDDAP